MLNYLQPRCGTMKERELNAFANASRDYSIKLAIRT
jgi:hypothetical protein